MAKTWVVITSGKDGKREAFEQQGVNRADALARATRRALGDDTDYLGRSIVSFTYGKLRAHVGIGGFGYCTACGRTPRDSSFTRHCPAKWEA